MKSHGVDFDDLFDPDVIGDGPNARGYSVGNVAIKYADIQYGSKRADIGYAESGVDLSNKWAAKGTAVYSLPINGQTFFGFSSGTQSSAMVASVKVSINSNGTYAVQCVGNATVTTPAAGTWLPAGKAVSNYQVRYITTQTSQASNGPATITNDASAYAACTTSRNLLMSATTAQHGGAEIGGHYTVQILIKDLATGAVRTTTIYAQVQSSGDA